MPFYNNMADVAYDITCTVNRKINEARVDLDTKEQKIIDLLISVEDKAKEYRLVNISSLTREEDRLAGRIVELVGSLCGYVEKNIHPLTDQASFEQPDEIPMQSIYIQGESLSEYILHSASLVETLAGLLKVKPLDDPEVISNCIELIKNACKLEKDSVTEKWPDSEDPRGMIGCTYSQLQVYYPKKYPDIAQGFKDTYQCDADELLDTAKNILEEISGPSPDIDKCFCEASQLLFDASDLVGRASRWIASQCG